MDSLYNQTNHLVQKTQQCFQQLECGGTPEEVEREIQEKIDLINRFVVY